MALDPQSAADIDRFFTSVKSLNELDKLEVRNLVNKGLIGTPTDRENYFMLNYNRAVLSVELLLTLKYFKDFQVVAMIARSLFEIAVEMWMITKDKDAAEKITAFTEHEKLRSARKIVRFGVNDPNKAFLISVYIQYIAQNEARILACCSNLFARSLIGAYHVAGGDQENAKQTQRENESASRGVHRNLPSSRDSPRTIH